MRDLTAGNETKLLVLFSLPMLIGNVFQQFYNMVDSWVVGNFVGKEALAAVGASFPIVFLMISLVMGVSMGANVVIAQNYGAKNYERLRAAVETTYLTIFWSSLVLTAVGLLAVGPILNLLRVPDAVRESAAVYLSVIVAGLVFTYGYNGVGAVLRGLGDSRTPLYMLIIATLLNVVLDLAFVVLFGWGVAGVAWATVIAQAVSFLGSLLYLNRTHELLRTNFLALRFDRELFAAILKIGLPTGIQQTLVSLGLMFMSAVVNGYGTDVMAGFSAASRIDSFAAMPAMNLSMALSSFVGQNLGAGRPDRARRGFRAALLIGLGITAVLVVFLLLAGDRLVGIFSADPAVVAVGVQYLSVIAPFYFAFAAMFIANGLIRGAGEAIVPLVSTLVAMWLVRVPAAALFSSLWGAVGIWWAMPTGWVIGMCISLVYYRTGRWASRPLAGGAPPAASRSSSV